MSHILELYASAITNPQNFKVALASASPGLVHTAEAPASGGGAPLGDLFYNFGNELSRFLLPFSLDVKTLERLRGPIGEAVEQAAFGLEQITKQPEANLLVPPTKEEPVTKKEESTTQRRQSERAAMPSDAPETKYITETEVKVPKNVANVLLGVILGLLATNYMKGREGLDLQSAVMGGGLGGLMGLLAPDIYSTSIKPALKELLGVKEEQR
ncbi:MAG: hypothetical protein ABIK73_08970 [candidate division WOR-3 bacterium]